MPNGIQEPKLKSIEELLVGGKCYQVPTYQRNFDWEDQVEELWEDIQFAVGREGEDYFFGTIVLNEKGYDNYEIIDGQQRLICISLIFSAIRNVFQSRKSDWADRIYSDFLAFPNYEKEALPEPKLRLNKTNNEVYLDYVIESKNEEAVADMLKDKKRLHPSNVKLLDAYRYFLKQVSDQASSKGTDYEDVLLPLIRCIGKRIKLIVIPVSSEEGAYLVFESVNARGKELAVSDLVKNRLYYESASKVERAQVLWEQMETSLGGRSIPEYLRHFWIAKRADEKNQKIREKTLYRSIRSSFPAKKRVSHVMELLRDLSSSAGDYSMITDYNLWPDDPNCDRSLEQAIGDLKRFRVSQCNPALLNAIQTFEDSKEIVKAFELMANFSFRYNVIGDGTSGSLEAVFANLAYSIRVGDCTSARGIGDTLRALSQDRKFRVDFELATIAKRKGSLGRYVLARIENHIRRKKEPGRIDVVDPDARHVSLEHVLPQNQDKHKNWALDFSQETDPSDYVYRLGNLTLLTSSINRDLADKSFKDKKASFIDGSELLIDDYLRNQDKWGDKQIDGRQHQLAKYALAVWRL